MSHTTTSDLSFPSNAVLTLSTEIEVGLLTGGGDRPYALGLAMALLAKGIRLDFIGSDRLECPDLRANPHLNFLNLRGDQRADAGVVRKVSRILSYYARLIRYAWTAKPKVFHILWNNKFEVFDRTLLMLFYKLRGKRLVLTVHNVNVRKRDSSDSVLNRLTLRIQYHLADHIFVHSEKMKSELTEDFGVDERTVAVIPIGINNSVPTTNLSPDRAKRRLGIGEGERTILFFGHIAPYKGLEVLVDAFHRIEASEPRYRMIIAGEPKKGCGKYLDDIRRTIERDGSGDRIIQRIEYIPDEATELYFKAADVLALPYTQVYQSGVLVLGYTFGLPVIATDVGSLREDIVEGRTGFLCRPCDPIDLARTIEIYFESNLFRSLTSRRQEIREYANSRYSWDVVGEMTRNVYTALLGSDLP